MSRALHAGNLRDQITIQSQTTAADAEGQPVKTWANLSTNPTVWAEVRYMRPGSNEFEAMQKITSVQSLHVTIRYRTDLDVTMRVVFNSENWNIHAIQHRVERDYTTLICSKTE